MKKNKLLSFITHKIENVVTIIRLLDDIVHVAVALLIIGASGLILIITVKEFSLDAHNTVLLIINNALLVMILLELLWSIIICLRRKKFTINPYLFMGIISSVRSLLVVEARLSLSHGGDLKEYLVETGTSIGIILALVTAYFLINKQKYPEELKG